MRQVLREHRVTWGKCIEFPALELGEIDAFLRLFGRAPLILWLQARTASALVALGQRGAFLDKHIYVASAGMLALLMLALARRYRLSIGVTSMLVSLLVTLPVRQRALRTILPWLSRRLY